MTPEQLKKILPLCRDPRTWQIALDAACKEFDITGKPRLSMFLAQIGHESAQLNSLRENLSYGVRGLMATWPRRFPTEASAMPFARQPERLANFVYADRLGNGNYQSGDGFKYRGGGVIQTTGKANYEQTGKALGIDLVAAPQKIEEHAVAARAGAWFWKVHGCNELADVGDIDKVTETINGPAKLGLAARMALWLTAQGVLS